ncbi:hypothetical protein KEM56_006965 [Ascosphaera pollenicola]|nr:hypothetical protein KEM56_006965 [Ascosphaera pollenicola]
MPSNQFQIKNIFSIVALAPIVLAQWVSNVPVDYRSLEEIYKAAKQEKGTLVVFAGGDAANQNDAFIQLFTQRFPGTDLNWTVDLFKYHDSRIDREWCKNDPKTDVILLQTLHDFPIWKRQDRFLYYKPPIFDQIYASKKDLDSDYTPFWINMMEIPNSYAEFAYPKWKGKLVLTYPNDNNAVAFPFSTIISKYGFDWLESLAANDILWLRETYSPQAAIEARHNSLSERALSFTAIVSGSFDWWSFKDPEEDVEMSWSHIAVIFSSTSMPETAKLLVAYFTSEELNSQMAASSEYVPLKNIDKGALYDNNVTEITHFQEFQKNRQVVEW